MSLLDLPAVNASLNGLSTLFLSFGYWFIRHGNRTAHRNCMVAAFCTSALFLISYLAYHTYVSYMLGRGPTLFQGPGWFKPIYLLILGTHSLLAIIIVPMAIISLYTGWRDRLDRHRRLSRWTWPLWMYVSVTGVLIYLLLYQIFPSSK